MKKAKIGLLVLAVSAVLLLTAQTNSNNRFQFPKIFAGVPSGACGNQSTAVNTLNGDFYTCLSAAWHLAGAGGSGSGTVTASGSPTNHQIPIWTTATNLKGISCAVNTVLHGATAADPACSAVDLAADVGATIAPVANGGTGTSSTLTGLVRGSASAMTAAELSGDATTSGSNAVTVAKVNGNTYPANAGFTSGGVPYYSSTSAQGSSTLLAANGVVLGGGAGNPPTATAAGSADQMFLVQAAVPPVWVSVPNCPGGSGYSTSTHAFICTAAFGLVGTTTAVTVNAASSSDQILTANALTAGATNTVGKTWHVHAAGTYTTGATGNGTMTFKLKACSVAGCGSGAVVTLATFGPTTAGLINTTAAPFNVDMVCTTVSTGASGTARCEGLLNAEIGVTVTAATEGHLSVSVVSSAVDWTAAESITLTVSGAGASANNSFTSNQQTTNAMN